MTDVLAVDFGATSIRVARVSLDRRPPRVEVVHRYAHGPLADATGHLRWDWARLVSEMEKGLLRALERGPAASIGVDTWGVDYGLLDSRGELLAPPFSYRDGRTAGFMDVVHRIGEDHLYRTTGVQLQAFNTLFQLAAHDPDEMGRARHVLLLPELLVHHLTGMITAERTSAGTTALVDVASGTWSPELTEAAGVALRVLPEIRPAGTLTGTWRGIPVHLVGGHDTASAVVAIGDHAEPGCAFVATGTWFLVGQERAQPDTTPAAQRANFTNEPGAAGGFRHLKNLAGWWLLNGCLPEWGHPPLHDLLHEAAEATSEPVPVFDVADPAFLHPTDMLGAVAAAAGLPRQTRPALVVRSILESLAAGTAGVLAQLGAPRDVHLLGGGAQAPLFRRLLQSRTGLPVHRGPVEATALGNAMMQGIALGCYQDLAGARAHLSLGPGQCAAG